LFTFRQVLRDANFGEMLAGSHEAVRMEHLFCSIQMMTSRQLWNQVGPSFYDYIVVDEAHHGTAASYRPLFDHFEPKILLGLTATPERMDGGNVAADFHNRFAAEIRLPEALEEKLLCPFHYFGVADPVDISKDHFWRNGRYDDRALEKVYTGDDILAKMRVDTIVRAPKKKHNNCTVPFVFLGPARHVSHQKERPIQMVWQLSCPMPVEMFEENRRGATGFRCIVPTAI
jgi:superfamily II DNA or RNA helicase